MNDNTPRETLRLPWVWPMNFKFLGDLAPEKERWWHDFTRAVAEAQRNFDKRGGK